MMRKLFVILMFSLVCGLLSNISAAATGDEARGNDTVVSSTSVYSGNGMIVLNNNSEEAVTFNIYSITGQMIKSVTIQGGNSNVDLPKGFYIVKCNQWSKRVIVK